jgi:hypothetical protein
MKKLVPILSVLIVLASSRVAGAAPVILTFGELPFQPVDGLSFMGVTFHFTVDGVSSMDANYDSGGPGVITYVQDPSLEGNAAGTLTLDFDAPTPVLQFGVALSAGGALAAGCSIELFDSDLSSIGIIDVATASIISFTEGRFSYRGRPVSRAAITFNSDRAARFAFDNLTFDDGLAPVPTVERSRFAPGGRPWKSD